VDEDPDDKRYTYMLDLAKQVVEQREARGPGQAVCPPPVVLRSEQPTWKHKPNPEALMTMSEKALGKQRDTEAQTPSEETLGKQRAIEEEVLSQCAAAEAATGSTH